MKATTLVGWMRETFDAEDLAGISRYGCGEGWAEITYTQDIVRNHDAFEREVWEAVMEMAAEAGAASPVALAAETGERAGLSMTSLDDMKTAALWLAVEFWAGRLVDEEEGE